MVRSSARPVPLHWPSPSAKRVAANQWSLTFFRRGTGGGGRRPGRRSLRDQALAASHGACSGGPERWELRVPVFCNGAPIPHAHGRRPSFYIKAAQRAGRQQLEVGRWQGRLGGAAGGGGGRGAVGRGRREGGRKSGGELSRALSQRGDEFVCPRMRLRPGLRNWELGLERHPWKWEEVALGP